MGAFVFQCTSAPRILYSKVVGVFIATCGMLALQGGPIYWVAVHRMHHRYTDKEGDPHSPRREVVAPYGMDSEWFSSQ